MNIMEKKLTGYPSIDKPWLKYYGDCQCDPYENESLYSLLYKKNQANLSYDAFVYFGNRITFGDFFEKIDSYAYTFQNAGIRPGDCVIVLGLNTPEIIAAIYALNRIGAVCSLEYVSTAPEKIADFIDQLKPKYALIIDNIWETYSKVLNNNVIEKIFLTHLLESAPLGIRFVSMLKRTKRIKGTKVSYLKHKKVDHTSIREYSWDKTMPAIILSTSGTTGIPKKAELSCYAFNALAMQIQHLPFALEKGKRLLCPAPLFLAFGISLSIHMPLVNNVCLILSPSPEPAMATKLFFKHKPAFFMGAHAFIDSIMEYAQNLKCDLSFLDAILIGGEAASDTYIKKVDTFLQGCNSKACGFRGYGMTELAACSTIETPDARRNGTVGIPLCDVNMKVIDQESGDELGYNQIGELCISSPCQMLRYRHGQATLESIIERDATGRSWIHTGDLGKIDEDGFIYIVGRIKRIEVTYDLVSRAQVKFFPDYIQMVVESLPNVDSCAVVAIDDEVRQRVPVAFIKPVDKQYFDLDELRYRFESSTDSYNIPAKWFLVDSFPLLPNGKVDYRALEREAVKERYSRVIFLPRSP